MAKLQSSDLIARPANRATARIFRPGSLLLTQHHDYAVKELNRVPKDSQTAGYDDARKKLDNALEDLENALAEARGEIRNES